MPLEHPMPPHPYLVQQYRAWIVRIIIPADVRHLFPDAQGKPKRVIKRSTGESDIYRAQTVAAPVIAGIKREIAQAKLTLRPPLQDRADAIVAEFQKRTGAEADRLVLRDLTMAVLRQERMSIDRYMQNESAGLPPADVARTVKLLTGKLTPFGRYLDASPSPDDGEPLPGWTKSVKVAPKTRDEYRSGIEEFMRRIDQPLESLTSEHVQIWVDYLLSDDDGDALDAKTVNKKLSGLHNYWLWMGKRGLVKDYRTRQPFRGLDVQNAFDKVKAIPARYEPQDVVRLWQAAEGDLAEVIRIGAYTGARRESILRLRIPDIKYDPQTNVRFMHMTGKTEAGDRDVPLHSAIAELIDRRIRDAGADGYLFQSANGNQYGIRATGIGKQFAALKTHLGFGPAHDFHSLRRTAIHLFELAECPEGVCQDIVGHKKLSITFGLYSGITRIDQRAKWVEQALIYPGA